MRPRVCIHHNWMLNLTIINPADIISARYMFILNDFSLAINQPMKNVHGRALHSKWKRWMPHCIYMYIIGCYIYTATYSIELDEANDWPFACLLSGESTELRTTRCSYIYVKHKELQTIEKVLVYSPSWRKSYIPFRGCTSMCINIYRMTLTVGLFFSVGLYYFGESTKVRSFQPCARPTMYTKHITMLAFGDRGKAALSVFVCVYIYI